VRISPEAMLLSAGTSARSLAMLEDLYGDFSVVISHFHRKINLLLAK